MTDDRDGRPLIIGIAGGSGSGKTTIAHALAEQIGEDNCAHILHDAYYRDLSDMAMEDRARVNYDHPDSLETELLVEHLHALMHGAAVEVPIYDFAVHNRSAEVDHVAPRPVVLVEGVLALAEATLREVMDLKIFVDTDSDLRFMRRLERDLNDRGRTRESVYEQYLATVRPMHMEFVEPSKAYADLVIPEGYNIGAVSTVLGMVREFLRSN
jgi:uridine kinase